ncbi:SGNH/GDSL hydrolase family protein [Sphingomonas morindae]|uniref:SGNH/GDSL hydrolase family protein n=1 Tax=Sphingomonas morindae TaxID=1541170 RepID=A0ABY4X6C3_9SPHN|nr:SGNH/GDSL hydrolase family protein [Sphingomonas morindae]USI72436.1 SGNH/GDSL hydrolase family protein [Sphingomonas morindae]
MFFAALVALTPAVARPVCGDGWHAAWTSAQMVPKPEDTPPTAALADATLRQTVTLSAGGPRQRLRFSNAFGTTPLRIDHVTLALAQGVGAASLAGPALPVRFAGAAAVEIPAGVDYLSDPVALPARRGTVLAVSLHLAAAPAPVTGHPGARTTSWLAPGAQSAAAMLTGARGLDHWYWLSGVESAGCGPVLVALGDSITDGHGAITNGDTRWTDYLARRLPPARGLANQGIGGNRVLDDGLGPSALARFDRDVLATTGADAVILLEGINDLGTFARTHVRDPAAHAALVARLTAGYAQLVARAHAKGLRLYGATIMPFTGSDYYAPTPQDEADRVAVNQWLRAPGHTDGVIDFDRATRDPAHPERLLPGFDSGDHLHPSPAGYRAMAEAVPLALVAPEASPR